MHSRLNFTIIDGFSARERIAQILFVNYNLGCDLAVVVL